MAEVFISYARTDQGFARDIHAALQKVNRDTWIDWRSIPDSAKWRAEIFAAIEAADNFVFVISPDSVKSWMCGQEVSHAFTNNKRLITILYHPVESKKLLPALAQTQWIDYPNLGFEQTFERLIRALDTDLDWVRQHTRLFMRAAEWKANGRDNGFLLHGMELRDAIRWLEQAATIKDRKPTEIHEQYIRASEEWEAGEVQRLTELTEEKEQQRQEAKRQKRQAVNARRKAERERLKAEKANRVAVARELVAFSTLSLEEDSERSILLAMHAVDATRRDDGTIIPEAEDALHRAILRSPIRFTLSGHTAQVDGVALSADGRLAVSASHDHTLKVWDVDSGRELRTLHGHVEWIFGVALSGDGRIAVSASKDKTLKVWDVESGRELRTLTGHSGQVTAVALSTDGRRAASVSADAMLKVWDVSRGRELITLHLLRSAPRYPKGDVHSILLRYGTATTGGGDGCVALSGDGSMAVFAPPRMNVLWAVDIHLWRSLARKRRTGNASRRWKPGRELRLLGGHSDWVAGVALNKNGSLAVSACFDGTLNVWDVESGRVLRTIQGHSGHVTAVAVTPDGQRAVSASYDKTLKVWDVSSGRDLRTLTGHLDRVMAAAVTPDGQRAVSASWDNTLKMWNLGRGYELRTLIGHTSAVAAPEALLPFEEHLGKSVLPGTSGVAAVAVTPDGQRAVSASADKTLKVWDLGSGRELRTLKGHNDAVLKVAVTPDGQRAVSGSEDKTLKVWDLGSGRELRTLKGHEEAVLEVAVTPDGQCAVSASADKTLKVWDLGSGRELRTLKGHEEAVLGVAVTPDGQRAVSASLDNTFKVWELGRGRELRTIKGANSFFGAFLAVVTSGDGRRPVSLKRRLRVWESDSGCELRTLTALAAWRAALSPDGARIAFGSRDKTVQIWDMEGGRELMTLAGHGASVNDVVWTPDGKMLLSAGADGIIQVYAMDIDLLMSLARSRVTRNLTLEECQKYLHLNEVPPIQ